MRRIVICSDLQIPYHNERQLRSFVRFIRDYQPDELVNIGDLTDYPQPSRWNKDTKGEFEGSIYADSELTKRIYFDAIRKVYTGPHLVHIGNHDRRPLDYQEKYAPALNTEAVKDSPYYYGNMVDFDSFGVQDAGKFYDIAPGWVSTHGHEGTPLRHSAGDSAIAAARKLGKSVVQGHTHRLGLKPETIGYSGNSHILWGFEVGNMMNMRKADYIMKKSGGANWQSGFGVLYVDGRKVQAIPVYMTFEGVFMFEGRIWKLYVEY
jgi:predicted phosphodiesterase